MNNLCSGLQKLQILASWIGHGGFVPDSFIHLENKRTADQMTPYITERSAAGWAETICHEGEPKHYSGGERVVKETATDGDGCISMEEGRAGTFKKEAHCGHEAHTSRAWRLMKVLTVKRLQKISTNYMESE